MSEKEITDLLKNIFTKLDETNNCGRYSKTKIIDAVKSALGKEDKKEEKTPYIKIKKVDFKNKYKADVDFLDAALGCFIDGLNFENKEEPKKSFFEKYCECESKGLEMAAKAAKEFNRCLEEGWEKPFDIIEKPDVAIKLVLLGDAVNMFFTEEEIDEYKFDLLRDKIREDVNGYIKSYLL